MDFRKTVAIVSRDLIFKSKVSELSKQFSRGVSAVRDQAGLREALELGATLVLIDLSLPGLDRPAMLSDIQSCGRPVRVVAYFSHVDHELEAQARAEGIAEVLPRSAFVKLLPEILSQEL